MVTNYNYANEGKVELYRKLKGFHNLQKIYEFSECFELAIEVEIKGFKKGYHLLNQETADICLECICKN